MFRMSSFAGTADKYICGYSHIVSCRDGSHACQNKTEMCEGRRHIQLLIINWHDIVSRNRDAAF